MYTYFSKFNKNIDFIFVLLKFCIKVSLKYYKKFQLFIKYILSL